MYYYRRYYFLLLIFIGGQCYSQSPYCVKDNYERIAVHISANAESRVLFFIDKDNFFYCDSLIGNYYSCEIPRPIESAIIGYINRDSIQLFEKLSLKSQKNIINRTFKTYYKLIVSKEKDTLIHSLWVDDSAYYVSAEQLYYTNTFYPILVFFDQFYKKTADTSNLLSIFKLSPYADGEFSESMSAIYFYCYLDNKALFIRQLKRVRNEKYFNKSVSRLIDGVVYFLPEVLRKQRKNISNDEVEKSVYQEIEKINKLLGITK